LPPAEEVPAMPCGACSNSFRGEKGILIRKFAATLYGEAERPKGILMVKAVPREDDPALRARK